MNNKRLWQGGFIIVVVVVVVVVVLLAYVMFTSIPYSVSKSYEESIYNSGGQVVKTVPVKVSGKVYRGIFETNQFVGKVEIDGKTYAIHTFRNRRPFGGTKSSYPYLGVATTTGSQNYTVATAKMIWDLSSWIQLTNRLK